MKKKALITLLLLVMMLLLAACGDQKKENKYVAFYLNADVTKIVPQDVELTSTTPTEQIQELLKLLQQQPEDAGLRQTIPNRGDSDTCSDRKDIVAIGEISVCDVYSRV